MIFLVMIVIQLIVIGSLIFILKTVLKRHFGRASSHLEVLNQDTERRLAESKKKMDEANAYYDDLVARAKTDVSKMKQQLIDEGVKEKNELIERARKEADEIMDRAKSAKKLLEENWDIELAQRSREITLSVLRQILPTAMTQDIQSEWIKQMLTSGMEGLGRLNVPESVSSVKIVTAVFLTEAQKKSILAILKEKIGRSFELQETIDPTLILGFRLEMGSIVLDGSLSWKIREALKNARSSENA